MLTIQRDKNTEEGGRIRKKGKYGIAFKGQTPLGFPYVIPASRAAAM